MLYFSPVCALGSLFFLPVVVSSQFCFIETCIFMLGNYKMTALQKPWGSLVQVWYPCLWGLELLQEPCSLGEGMVGERMGGPVHSVCLAWDVWIVLIKTGRTDQIWDLLVSQSHLLPVILTDHFLCKIHFWIFLALLLSSNFCYYGRAVGLIWWSWNKKQNFTLILLVKQDQSLTFELLT